MTANEMVAEVCGPVSWKTTNATQKARALLYLNEAQLDMLDYDWPELINRNASFTTDGDENYDLTSASYLGSTFWRVIVKSVRISTVSLVYKPKGWIDSVDPDRTGGSTAEAWGLETRTWFWLWPAEGSGSTVYLDWLAKPTAIIEDLAEASISFDVDRHSLIVAGGVWRAKKYEGFDEWSAEETGTKKDIKNAFNKSHRVRQGSVFIIPSRF